MTTSKNLLEGQPLTFGNIRQHRIATATEPEEVYDPRPGFPDLFINCLCCADEVRIRKRWDVMEEKMRFVTPRVHTCRCGARILLFRYHFDYEKDPFFNDGEVVFRRLGAYEAIDPLCFCHRYDSWKYYELYKILDNDEFSRQNTLPL